MDVGEFTGPCVEEGTQTAQVNHVERVFLVGGGVQSRPDHIKRSTAGWVHSDDHSTPLLLLLPLSAGGSQVDPYLSHQPGVKCWGEKEYLPLPICTQTTPPPPTSGPPLTESLPSRQPLLANVPLGHSDQGEGLIGAVLTGGGLVQEGAVELGTGQRDRKDQLYSHEHLSEHAITAPAINNVTLITFNVF